MKLTDADKDVLLDLGHDVRDFPQIEMATHASRTTYQFLSQMITRENAIELLGRERYLAGISRSAFHWTSSQNTDDGEPVYFDSCKLFT